MLVHIQSLAGRLQRRSKLRAGSHSSPLREGLLLLHRPVASDPLSVEAASPSQNPNLTWTCFGDQHGLLKGEKMFPNVCLTLGFNGTILCYWQAAVRPRFQLDALMVED